MKTPVLFFFMCLLMAMSIAQSGQAACNISSQAGVVECFDGATSGNHKDQLVMSLIYWNGIHVKSDLQKALKWALVSIGGIPEESHDDIESKTRSFRFVADMFQQMQDTGSAKTAYKICAGMPSYNNMPVNFEADACGKILSALPENIKLKKLIYSVEDLRNLRKEMYNDQEMLRLAGRGGVSKAKGLRQSPAVSASSAQCGLTEEQYNDINNSYTTKENCAKAWGWFKCMGYKGAIALWFENKKGYCSIDSMYATCQQAQNLMNDPGGALCWER